MVQSIALGASGNSCKAVPNPGVPWGRLRSESAIRVLLEAVPRNCPYVDGLRHKKPSRVLRITAGWVAVLGIQ